MSLTGEYTLEVDPGDRYGRGAASYRLTSHGREVWRKRLPFTLWEAAVADDGAVAGYAYSNGWRGYGFGGDYPRGPGEFQVVILNPDGSLRLDRKSTREESRFMHTPPHPLAAGLLLDAENDRFVVRLHDPDVNRGQEEWYPYRLSTGEALPTLTPRVLMENPGPARFILAARPVLGTSLTLMHWWRFDSGEVGARFTLVGLEGRPVWSLELPRDYTLPGNEKAEEQRRDWIRRHGALLAADRPAEFELRFVSEGRRVRFSVRRTDKGWQVTEVSRQPYLPTPAAPRPPEIPSRRLRLLGSITLRSPADTPQAIRGVRDFAFDGLGRIALLREEARGPTTFMLVSQQGRVLRQVRLAFIPIRKEWAWSGFTWVGRDRFVVTRSKGDVDGGSAAWWVDFETGSVKPIARYQGPPVERIAGFPDGGFVVLGTTQHRSSMETSLHGYDAGGRERWKRVEDLNSKAPEALFSPEDMAATTEGKVAVVDVLRHTVQVFDRRGRYERTIPLETAWKRKPNYPSKIVADEGGGFAVEDFQGCPPVVRMRADGAVRRGLRPRFGDGRTFSLLQLAVAPDGRMWTCDGYSLLRLDASGRVDRVLGSAPSPDRLGEIRAVRVDGSGRIYALSQRTGSVHLFDPRGRHLRVYRPGRAKSDAIFGGTQLAVTRNGHVYLEGDASGGYLHFDPSGQPLGLFRVTGDPTGEWYFGDGGSPLWVVDRSEIRLVRAGVPDRRIYRRPDHTWLADINAAAVAPDGRIAVLEGWLSGQLRVSLYSPAGAALRSFRPSSVYGAPLEAAFDGNLLVLGSERGVVAYDRMGRPRWKFPRGPPLQDGLWQPFLLGRELLLFDGSHTLFRYLLPRP
jgi:sugar lactone lactonase YvrE